MARDHWYELKGWINKSKGHYLSRIIWVEVKDKNPDIYIEKQAQEFKDSYPTLIKEVTWEMYRRAQ